MPDATGRAGRCIAVLARAAAAARSGQRLPRRRSSRSSRATGTSSAAPFHGDPTVRGGLGSTASATCCRSLDRARRGSSPCRRCGRWALSATVDLLLAHPHWRDRDRRGQDRRLRREHGRRVDAADGRRGHDEVVRAVVGAGDRRSAAQGRRWATSRISGQFFLPAFGRDQRGLDGIALPYLAIAGTADTPRRRSSRRSKGSSGLRAHVSWSRSRGRGARLRRGASTNRHLHLVGDLPRRAGAAATRSPARGLTRGWRMRWRAATTTGRCSTTARLPRRQAFSAR